MLKKYVVILLISQYLSIIKISVQQRACYFSLIFSQDENGKKVAHQFSNKNSFFTVDNEFDIVQINLENYVGHISIFVNDKKNEQLSEKLNNYLQEHYDLHFQDYQRKFDVFDELDKCNYHEFFYQNKLWQVTDDFRDKISAAYQQKIQNCSKLFDFYPEKNVGQIENLHISNIYFYYTWFHGEPYHKSINIFLFEKHDSLRPKSFQLIKQ